MREIREDNHCGRAEQLVAYLYGESAGAAGADFERHLSACVACRDELAAYGTTRAAVADWRAELISSAPSVSLAAVMRAGEQHAPTTPVVAIAPRRAAWDALREFFSLTPAWLRVASAAFALAVCALAALAVLNAEVRWRDGDFAFSTGLRPLPAAGAGAQTPTQADATSQPELARLSAERDAALRELEATRAELETSRAANIDAVYQAVDESESLAPVRSNAATRPAQPAAERTRRPNNAPDARAAST